MQVCQAVIMDGSESEVINQMNYESGNNIPLVVPITAWRVDGK